jgi:outer membrane receptor protein involved in Fe transport
MNSNQQKQSLTALKMKLKKRPICHLLAILLILDTTVSHADDVDIESYFAMSPAELAETPVTSIATGTPRPNFRSAGSTSVITEDQIKTMGATELHEVLENVPGIHASLQPINNDIHYSIRGIANNSNSEILFLLNGTRITTAFRGSPESALDIPVAAIKQVEVIRGPASAVYGADAFAGVINVITKKGKDIDGAKLGVRAGNWDSQSGWGQVGNHWAGWDVAASMQYQHTQGDPGRIIQEDTQTSIDRAFSTNASLAPGAMNTRYKSLNTHLNLQRKHWDIGFWAFNGFDIGTRSGAGGALDPIGNGESAQYLGDMRFSTEDSFDDWEFLAHLSYLHSDVNAKVNVFPENARLPIDGEGNVNFSSTITTLFTNGAIEDVRHVQKVPSIELSSVYKGLNKHLLRFSAGFRYEELTVNNLSNFGYGRSLPFIVDATLIDKTGTKYAFLKDTNRSIGTFLLQDEWQIYSDLQLTAGLRYDHYSDFGGTVNPRLALVWDINEQLTSKWLYGKAFRAPSFFEMGFQDNTVNINNPNLKPETINTVEWVFDYRPTSSFRTGLNLYYFHIDDHIDLRPIDNISSEYKNWGVHNGYGTELEWNWALSEQWNLSGNYSWQNAQNERINGRITGVPEHQVYFAVLWHFMPQWQLQSQLKWIGGRTRRDIDDTRPLKDYETFDFTLRGNKLWGHINLAASLRNAFDANNLEPAGIIELPVNLPMPGRNFYLEASVDF